MKFFYATLIVTLMAIGASAQNLTVTVDNIIEDPCEGVNRGAIEITVTGGTPGYEFNWEGPFGLVRNTKDVNNIPGGDWELTVYDTNRLMFTTTIFVPIASGMLTATVLSEYGQPSHKYNISEYGKSDGWIQVEYVLNGNGNPTETVIDTVEVIKFLEVADEATLINPVTQATIWVKNYGDYIRTSESFDVCKIYNITGSVVKQVNQSSEIPIIDIPTGVYVIHFEFGSAEIVQRFFIE